MTRVVSKLINADCLAWMRAQPDNSVDLVFGSPPYEAARTYGIDFKLTGTVPKVASMCGRHSIGVDVRASQLELTAKRLRAECPMFAEVQVA